MNKKLKTKTLDFEGCKSALDFYDRIIDALELGVGYCGRNWSAIYDFACTESTVEKLIIKNTDKLTDELKSALPMLYKVLDKVTQERKRYGVFIYEVVNKSI